MASPFRLIHRSLGGPLAILAEPTVCQLGPEKRLQLIGEKLDLAQRNGACSVPILIKCMSQRDDNLPISH